MPSEYKYDIVISYAGEDKVTVDRIERLLRQEAPSIRIFYAPLEEADLWGKDLAGELPTIFREEGRYCVMFISEHYAQKLWPTVERKAAIQRTVQQQEEYILPVRLDDTQLPGLSPTIAYYDMREKSPKDVVDGIKHKLGIQDSPEVTRILRRYEGERIKVNRENKPDQYFVYKGLLHYVDEGAARVCADRIGPFEDLDRDEEFILDIQEIRGSPYNRLKMIEVLDRIEAEEKAEKRQITISPLKQESAISIRLPFEPEMVRIPAGKFLMGTLEEDLWAIARKYGVDRKDIAREIPWHKVLVQEFEIGKYPLTNSQYWAFLQDTGHEPPLHWEGDQYPEELGDHPVVNVTWHDAVAYCRWLQEKTGKPYHLPAEAEWEKAARGTDRREFPWGDVWDVSKCNTRDGGPGTTTPVGQYWPHGDSFYGVADMAGNIWEWCADWLNAYPGNPFPDEDYGETHKVLRGSSWKTYRLAHCAYRYARTPESIEDDIGFRCARSAQ